MSDKTANDNNENKETAYGAAGYEENIPFAWRHIILVDKRSHAGRVISKIKQDIKSGKDLEKKG